MSELKPGDRAVVYRTNAGFEHLVGSVVTVCSAPFFSSTYWADGKVGWMVVETDCASRPYHGEETWMRACCLIRLPPDDEAKRLFRETEKPVVA